MTDLLTAITAVPLGTWAILYVAVGLLVTVEAAFRSGMEGHFSGEPKAMIFGTLVLVLLQWPSIALSAFVAGVSYVTIWAFGIGGGLTVALLPWPAFRAEIVGKDAGDHQRWSFTVTCLWVPPAPAPRGVNVLRGEERDGYKYYSWMYVAPVLGITGYVFRKEVT